MAIYTGEGEEVTATGPLAAATKIKAIKVHAHKKLFIVKNEETKNKYMVNTEYRWISKIGK